MVVVASGNPERTYLQAVNRVLNGIGKGTLISLASASRHTDIAMRAVQDARDDIFYKKLWQWRREHFEIDLTANQMWYELPANYQKMASPISLNRDDKMLGYMDYEDFLLKWPFLRAFPPGAGVGDIHSASQLAAQDETFGEPEAYTIWQQDYIGFMKIPDDDFVSTEVALFAHYWRHATALTSDNDDIGLPRELWSAHDLLASSRMKKALEYSDWQAEKVEGLQILDERSNSRREDQDTNVGYDPQINYNE